MPDTEPTRRRRTVHGAGAGMKSLGPGDVDLELVKAVAQAWYAHSGNPRPSSRASADEDDGAGGVGTGAGARRAAQRYRPSRFKLEAAAAAQRGRSWDFAQSLWDAYELVAVAQKIESSLVIAEQAAPTLPLGGAKDGATAKLGGGGGKRARESKRSLRSMFLRSSPRRFEESTS